MRFGLSSAPTNLDPRYATDAASARINRLIYRRLVDFDDQGQVVASLVVSSLTFAVIDAAANAYLLTRDNKYLEMYLLSS